VSTPTDATGRAAELRLAFDRGFAQPIEIDGVVKAELLAIRVGDQACAIRLGEIAGLFVDKKITPIPGSAPALLGVAGFRGAVMPVFNLQILLARSTATRPRWLAIAAGASVGLAFDAFEGQMRVSPDAIVRRPPDAQTPSYTREFVRMPARICPVIDLPSILGAIKTQKAEPNPNLAPSEER
jgi:purine-binding chemotaxis protein CheW